MRFCCCMASDVATLRPGRAFSLQHPGMNGRLTRGAHRVVGEAMPMHFCMATTLPLDESSIGLPTMYASLIVLINTFVRMVYYRLHANTNMEEDSFLR